MAEEKLMTKEEIQDALAAAEETFWPSVLDEAALHLETARENYPGINWNTPAGELLFRKTLTPMAMTCLRILREEKEKEEQNTKMMAEEKLVQTWEEFWDLVDKTGHSGTMDLVAQVMKQLTELFPGVNLYAEPMMKEVSMALTPLVKRVMDE